jgi:hypothetical protein
MISYLTQRNAKPSKDENNSVLILKQGNGTTAAVARSAQGQKRRETHDAATHIRRGNRFRRQQPVGRAHPRSVQRCEPAWQPQARTQRRALNAMISRRLSCRRCRLWSSCSGFTRFWRQTLDPHLTAQTAAAETVWQWRSEAASPSSRENGQSFCVGSNARHKTLRQSNIWSYLSLSLSVWIDNGHSKELDWYTGSINMYQPKRQSDPGSGDLHADVRSGQSSATTNTYWYKQCPIKHTALPVMEYCGRYGHWHNSTIWLRPSLI